MAQTTATINGATGNFSIAITRKDTGGAVTCNSGCSSGTGTNRTIDFTPVPGNVTYVFTVTDSSSCPPSTFEKTFSTIGCICPTLSAPCNGTPNSVTVSATIVGHDGTQTYAAQLVNNNNQFVNGTYQIIPYTGLSYSVNVPHNTIYKLQILKNGSVVCISDPITAENCPCSLSISVGNISC